jgi:tetratricopeptide (TPR) repeat protein
MLKGKGLKRIAPVVLLLFTWFTFASQFQFGQVHDRDKPADRLAQGKASYQRGDYEKSIAFLKEYIANPQNPREKQAEAYYFLAKNYDAVDPAMVKDMLLKALETDWFFSSEEKDAYFKKTAAEVRQAFMEKIPVDRYLEQAEQAFEAGRYDDAEYLYRVIAQKMPAKTFEQQIKKCAEIRKQREQALGLYRDNRLAKAYIALKPLLKLSPGDEQMRTAVTGIEQKIFPMIEAGDNYFNQKNYREALSFFEYVLPYLPEDAKIQERLNTCREMLEQERPGGKKIEKEGIKKQKKKKKFPILFVLLGTAAAVILFLLLKKKKTPAPTTGSIRVESTPGGARIWLDGTDTELTTPSTLTGLQSGPHAVKLVLAGYLDYQVNINVEAGKETVLFATLTPAPTPTFVTSTETVTVPEGGQGTFQVKLSERPAAAVAAVVGWFSGDTDISVISGQNLTFTGENWDSFQGVTLKAADDSDTENGEAVFRISAAGIPDKDIVAVEQDRGGPGYLTVTPNTHFSASGIQGGPFSPPNKTYILENRGTGAIQWSASQLNNWVTLSGLEGKLNPATSTSLTVSINSNANALPVGTYSDTITFLNTTNGGGSTTRTVTLQIISSDNPPTVTITSPANDATVSAMVTVQVNAVDDKGISKVEISIDNVLTITLTASPYTYQWDSTGVGNGSHTIKATAYDSANQTAEDQIGINVDNPG